MPFNHFILCCPLLILPSTFPSIRVFSNESVLHIRWPKYWSFSFNIGLSNEYSGLISFRIDWFDLLAIQATLKSLLQHHSSKASILQHSAFFVVQLSHPYMKTGKTAALTRWHFSRLISACQPHDQQLSAARSTSVNDFISTCQPLLAVVLQYKLSRNWRGQNNSHLVLSGQSYPATKTTRR